MNAEVGELSAAEIQMIHDMRRERQQIRANSKVRFPEMTVAKMEDLAAIALQFDKNVTALRPGQYDCIADLIRQNNVVAIIPTGGGKSLIWLLPALIIKRIDTQGVAPPPLVN